MKFNGYELKKYIVEAIKDLNFKEFSEVQKQVFNKLSNEKDIVAKSKTGSGKTHAFLIPIFNSLDENNTQTQAVIISPTNELANQIYKFCLHMASFSPQQINVKLYVGGTDRNKEVEKLNSNNPQIVIGTPGKIYDLAIKENVLKIFQANFCVIDEVDMTLDSGFKEQLEEVLYPLKDSRMMFFSATMQQNLKEFLAKFLVSPNFIDIEDTSTLNINHIWIPIKHKNRDEVLFSLLDTINPYIAIIFCNKKETVKELAKKLVERNYKVGVIHGDLSPRERKRTMKEVQNLKYQYLVCSDLAARGIDISGVSQVINYEIPKDYEFYLHRSGRTGRMNNSGECYSLYSSLDDVYLDYLNKKGIVPKYMEIKNNELVDYKGRNSRVNREKTVNKYEVMAAKAIKKPKKVKPGYKKKLKSQRDALKKKLKKNDPENKRKYYY